MNHDSANSIIGSVLAGALLALCVALPSARAETPPAAQDVPAAAPSTTDGAAAKRQDLARIQGEIKLSDETLARLRKEIQAIGADSEKLRQQLVETGNQTHETEAKVLGAEARLASLDSNEDNIRVSLDSKRGLLIEVLASLQPGEISEPLVSRFGVHLIQLLERRVATLSPRDQREVVRNMVRERKLDEAYAQWAQEVRGRAYVEYREPPT